MVSESTAATTAPVPWRALRWLFFTGSLITGFTAATAGYALPRACNIMNRWAAWSITCCSYALTMGLWFSQAFVDPGRIPRLEMQHERCSEGGADKPSDERKGKAVYYVGSIGFESSACEVCSIILPPETDHCDETDECIVGFDHYCPWIGMPVGLRNMWTFLIGTLVLCLHSLWCFAVATMGIAEAQSRKETIVCNVCALGTFAGWAFTLVMGLWTLYDAVRDRSQRLYTLHCSSRPEKTGITPAKRVAEAGGRGCPASVLESVHDSIKDCIPWIRHSGLRRLILGSRMPPLTSIDPTEAERLAWAWTVVLCGVTPI